MLLVGGGGHSREQLTATMYNGWSLWNELFARSSLYDLMEDGDPNYQESDSFVDWSLLEDKSPSQSRSRSSES